MTENGRFVKLKLYEGEEWIGKVYRKCSFISCAFSKCIFTDCEFEECFFENCNFSGTSMAMNKQYNSGKFINCTFDKCNLKFATFRFPVIDGCAFLSCKLKETNFDGSRFANTRFEGEMDSVFFRGYSVYASHGGLFSFSKFNARKLPNLMDSVDFSNAKLVSVSFSHAIDLSRCIFPDDGDNYVFVSDRRKTMEVVRTIVGSTWEPEARDQTLKFLDLYMDNKDRQEQPNDFVEAFTLRETDQIVGTDYGMKLFYLIKSLQNQVL